MNRITDFLFVLTMLVVFIGSFVCTNIVVMNAHLAAIERNLASLGRGE